MESIGILDWSILGDWDSVRLDQSPGDDGVSGNGGAADVITTGGFVSDRMDTFICIDGHWGSKNLGLEALGAAKPGDQFIHCTTCGEFLLELDLF